jgi:sortase A
MRRLHRAPLAWAALALFALGLWQVGGGLWIQAKAVVAQRLLADAWARTLAGEARVKPWDWADTWPVAKLSAPARGQEMYVLAGATGRTLAFGPGLVDGTAPPNAGGVTVISGHRDTHFAFLRDIAIGEELVLQDARGGERRYRVTAARVSDAGEIRVPAERDGLVLVTCWPFDAVVPGGRERYLVAAEPVAATLAARP